MSITIREKKRRKAYPLKRNHSFPSIDAPTEWITVLELNENAVVLVRRRASYDYQLYRWLRTQALRMLNRGFDFRVDEDISNLEDDWSFEEIALALCIRDLALAEADSPAVIERKWVPHVFHYDDPELEAIIGGEGVVKVETLIAPAVTRSGISFSDSPENKRSRENGAFGSDDLMGKALRAASFALEVFDPEFSRRLSAEGRKGGRISRRRSFSDSQLLEVAHLDPYRAARKLGCSVSTVQKRRKGLSVKK